MKKQPVMDRSNSADNSFLADGSFKLGRLSVITAILTDFIRRTEALAQSNMPIHALLIGFGAGHSFLGMEFRQVVPGWSHYRSGSMP